MTSTAIYKENLRVENTHLQSNSTYFTDAPVDNNGKGEAFSPTDTVATALANCMLTIMGIKAEQHKINMNGTKAEITKTMASNPRRISKIEIEVHFPSSYAEKEKSLLEKAAVTCPVFYSLHPDISKIINFHYPNA
ncbi:OsmC family protein [Mesonia maritima]|uniref:OsmC-like protein n=1 Tax=Mesonia maritima TaxID=1793873 RepID=A0ABU1K766_9FLAO|nr:OsmC family protein [Mesonia maritima]MDR6301460.1 putative OsmC-like protein [Mesonia maritima]